MAQITLTLSGGISLSTDKKTATIKMAANDDDQTVLEYKLSISKFSFHKKMYQPTKVVAKINIVPSTDNSTDYQEISRDALVKKFKNAKVTLKEGTFSIGDDFYVHEVLPHFGKDSMSVTLKIYSLDKLLTVEGGCRTFVAKKLGADILATEITKYIKPWTSDLKTKEAMTYSADGMQILKYEKDKEHIFPYLVQYNESFYDLLARTANRWGEFLYYENGMLNIGYDAKAEPIKVDEEEFEDIFYGDLNDKSLILATDGTYDYEADNSSLAGEPIQESPYYVRGQMVDFGGVPDKWVMKQFPGIFMNDKNLPTMMTNLLFDNWYYLCMKEGRTSKRNADHDKRYFKNRYGAPEQYNDNYTFHRDYDESEKVTASAFQEFTELDSEFTGKKYKEIVEKELTSGRNAIYINYGTTNPHLKLGSIITFGDKEYIVVDISGSYDANHDLVFKVVATAKDNDEHFYPAVIPSGHVRFAHPQVATITDANDYTRRNRVRVMFSWQDIKYNDKKKKKDITDGTKKLSSPWLTFASGQQGHPMAGKHYEGDHVMVGFQEGNVERPYVIGGLAEEDCRHLNIDSILTSRGMHKLILSDGTGAGMQAFLGGAVSPLSKTFMNFAPGLIPFWKWEKDKYFEGGFELSDYYGIYRITGSTDGRNVTIASNWGDVKINAFTGIDISAPNGDVNISGKNVTIEAGNNLKLESGTNVNYKLWKSKESTKDTAEQLLLDWGVQIGKRLAEVGHPLDLSIVRSAVEIFFRPVEGSLEVKSNRFLKLEADNSICRLPTKAYSVEIQNQLQNQLQNEIDIKTAKNAFANGQEMYVVFQVMDYASKYISNDFRLMYSKASTLVNQTKTQINELKEISNDPQEFSCKNYDRLKHIFWPQEEIIYMAKDYFTFVSCDICNTTDSLNENDVYNCVPSSTLNRLYGTNWYPSKNYPYFSACLQIVKKRTELINNLVKEFNEIRGLIYEMSHYEPTSLTKIIGLIYKGLTDKEIPSDYQEMILSALSRARCPKAWCYDISDTIKNFDVLSADLDTYTSYLRRQAFMNLLEDFRFTDDIRKPINGQVPSMPQADKIDASDDKNIMNNVCWNNFVQSLQVLPLVDVKDPLKKTEPSFLKAQWDKINFPKGAKEIKNWGEGKDGQILFASGNHTYALNDNKIERILRPTFSSLEEGNAHIQEEEFRQLTNNIREFLINL